MNKGSFLLEIAIGLSIIGIMSVFFITKQLAFNRISKEHITKANIELVADAIASFVASNYRIPGPAKENGIENNSICIGKIPYNTLGIPEKSTLDGRGRPLTYIVELELTSCTELHQNNHNPFEQLDLRNDCFCKEILKPKIMIKDQDSANDPVVFVIDTSDAKVSTLEDKIIVTPSANTFWIRRAMLLIHYVKTSPYQQAEANL